MSEVEMANAACLAAGINDKFGDDQHARGIAAAWFWAGWEASRNQARELESHSIHEGEPKQ